MLPNKLQHGDTLASLLQKYNEMVDYLREIRLVAGHGIRLNRLVTGTTIESTATATGGGASAPADTSHPFDVEIINKGTEESPSYYARVYNSAFPDYQYAGWLYVGQYEFEIPVTELQITTDGYFVVWMVVKYDSALNPPLNRSLRLYSSGVNPPEYGSDTAWCEPIALGKAPGDIQTYFLTNIEVTGRWI